MRQRLAWKTWLALIASIPLIVPAWSSSALAAEPTPAKSTALTSEPALRPQDVVLLPDNVLAGEVVDSNGNPLADTTVSVFVGRQEVSRGMTDQAGEFAISVPRGGVYWLSCGNSIALARTWSSKASPPQAEARVTLSPPSTHTSIRGQSPNAPWYAGTGPFGLSALGATAIAAAVATAVAVPIAVTQNNNNDNNAPSGNRQAALRPASP